MKNIDNQGRVDFECKLFPDGPRITITKLSNLVSTHILNDTLKIVKSSNKYSSYKFDEITYTIEITNMDDNRINNVFFQDVLPMGVEFFTNSIYVNNIQRRCQNPTDGFFIEHIKPKEKVVITFKVLISSPNISHISNLIINTSTIIFDYIYNIEQPPVRVKAHSNEVVIIIKDQIFKQSHISDVVTISENLPKIHKIDGIQSHINILKTKLYETPIPYGKELNISGFLRLLIIGNIEYNIKYFPHLNCFCESTTSELISYSTNCGFAVSLLVPCGITNYNNIEQFVKVIEEDVYFNLINCNEIYLNTTCLFKI